jgi:hypothetical protein
MWQVAAEAGLAVGDDVSTPRRRPPTGRASSVSPAFEGWEQNDDGSFNMLFG